MFQLFLSENKISSIPDLKSVRVLDIYENKLSFRDVVSKLMHCDELVS